LRGPLHRLDLLFHWLESGSEHGGGQLGYVAAIADSGFNALEGQQHISMKLDVAGPMLGFDAVRKIGPFLCVKIRP
jgi:hypothetical protein